MIDRKRFAVWSEGEACPDARALAARQGLPLLQHGSAPSPSTEYLLIFEGGVLFLQPLKKPGFKPFCIDYHSAEFIRRIKTSNRNDLLLKACGLKKGNHTVFDATFGLGYDALFLSSYEFEVSGAERCELVQELVVNALARAKEQGGYGESFVSFYSGDAMEYFRRFPEERFDVVYLDPMFPHEEEKSALARKEMRVFRDIVGEDLDAAELFRAALSHALDRVVVKRADDASPIIRENERKVDIVYEGKCVRYDVYLIHASAKRDGTKS